jgi:hypothetical protein
VPLGRQFLWQPAGLSAERRPREKQAPVNAAGRRRRLHGDATPGKYRALRAT